MTSDGLPLLGRPDGFDNQWTAEAVWVTHAGGVAEVMADLLLDGRTQAVDMAAFDVKRFAGLDASEAERRFLHTCNQIYTWPAV